MDEHSSRKKRRAAGLRHVLTEFAAALRAAGVAVSIPDIQGAYRSLALIDVFARAEVYYACRANMIKRMEDNPLFDRLFELVWGSAASPDAEDLPAELAVAAATRLYPPPARQSETPDAREPADGTVASIGERSYSAFGVAADRLFHELDETERRTICRALREVLHQTRRRRITARSSRAPGSRLHLSRILRERAMLGRDAVALHWRKERPTRHRIVFLCDVSGSMDLYSEIVVAAVHQLAQEIDNVELGLFSTDLEMLPDLRGIGDIGALYAVMGDRIRTWGNGTNIARSLSRFNRASGGAARDGSAIVTILSDGWDCGNVAELIRQARRLRRSCKRVFWLNPHGGTRGFEPLTEALLAMTPYVDGYLDASSLAALMRAMDTITREARAD